MKKLIPLLLLFVCSTAFAEKVRIYTDYSPVRVLKLVSGTDFDVEAGKSGLSGNFKDIDSSQIPADRSDRDAWKLSKGSVVVDQTLKAAIDTKISKRTQLIDKLKVLGLTDEDIELIPIKGEN